MSRSVIAPLGASALVSILCGSAASAAVFPLQWMSHAPVPFGSPVPSGSVFALPGVGAVTVTHNVPSQFTQARTQFAGFQNTGIVSGPNTYSWNPHEEFGAVNNTPTNPIVPVPWSITYTFSGLQPGGSIYLGVSGLGRTTSFGGGASSVTVNQNGTFIGENNPGGFGANQFTSGPGTFSLQNSVTGPGGSNPWWNTQLALIRIDDSVSSLTVNVLHISGDGLGMNIASVVPAPGAAGVLALGGLAAFRRRRTAC